ncbi:hypothetical protein MHYP_G00124450 [Metynnis hypsauchen]
MEEIISEEIISKGDAELTPVTPEGDTVWYIPHHGVYHPKKPDKLRVLFDCSAKYRGISLNDTLLTGPDLINSLVGVLCRFRKERVAVICDIERMFHQFSVTPEVRNYLKFLWWNGGDLDREPQEYRMAVHLFGAALSPGCANFGLKYLARQHKADYPSASAFIEKNFYVDDGLTSVPSIEAATKLITESQKLCKRGGLRLHKFVSNKKEVLDIVDASERATTAEPLDLSLNQRPAGRTLGIQWSIENDTFSFDVDLKDQPSTRCGILSVIASLFDPLGFVAPFTLSGKLILQELCRRSIDWDDSLPEDLQPRWEEWINGLQTLREIMIPRCYHPQDFGNIVRIELHHFSDASNVGYGACSYLRYKSDRDEVHCCLVMAKARVAPTKVTSIPRLELSAAVVAAKVSVMLKTELEMKIDEEFFWTDSQVVLAYEGPKFLWEQEVHVTSNPSTELLVGDPEVKSIQVFATKKNDCIDILNRLRRFSSWTMLLKVVARIKRLGSKQENCKDFVAIEDRERVVKVVIKLIQQQAFSSEVNTLKRRGSLPNSSPLYSLDPILDEGLLRVGGRLKHSSLTQELKLPIILPKDDHITRLILSHYHVKTCHLGRCQTLMELRANGFWVIGGSKSVAKLIHNCVRCRNLRRPVEEQRMA